MIGFEDKKYPSVSIQGIVLATNLLAIQQSTNVYIFLSIGLVLLLFAMQSINPRFFYYFPVNGFIGKPTFDVDTYMIYGFTYFAIFFMLTGLFGILKALIASVVICGSPFLWHYFGKSWIQRRLVEKHKNVTHELQGDCPCCGGELRIYRKVIDRDHGTESAKCFGECQKEWPEKAVSPNLG